MTGAEPLAFYPAYCFHLSPTINKWCPLRAIDIHGLERRPGFEGDNVFFTLNHPIRWVRIIGVVVAIDEYNGRRNYTVDDSTGKCIECWIDIPKPVQSLPRNEATYETVTAVATAPDPLSDIDVGMVIEVKGSTTYFRDEMHIKIQKLQKVGSTNQEVQFWNKIRDFHKDVLSRPWVLEEREVRRCKKQHIADVDSRERKKKKRRYMLTMGNDVGGKKLNTKSSETKSQFSEKELPTTKLRTQNPCADGQYNALGL